MAGREESTAPSRLREDGTPQWRQVQTSRIRRTIETPPHHVAVTMGDHRPERGDRDQAAMPHIGPPPKVIENHIVGEPCERPSPGTSSPSASRPLSVNHSSRVAGCQSNPTLLRTPSANTSIPDPSGAPCNVCLSPPMVSAIVRRTRQPEIPRAAPMGRAAANPDGQRQSNPRRAHRREQRLTGLRTRSPIASLW
jgi:hypothetical protein